MIPMNNTQPTPYELARDKYRTLGIDTDAVINTLSKLRISLCCPDGNTEYLCKAADKAFSYLPVRRKLTLSPHHADDRSTASPQSFQQWVDWARESDAGIDLLVPCRQQAFSSILSDTAQSAVSEAINLRRLGEYFGKALSVKSIISFCFDSQPRNDINPLAAAARTCTSLDTLFSDPIAPAVALDALLSRGNDSELPVGYAVRNNKAVSVYADESAINRIPAILMYTDELSLIFRDDKNVSQIAKLLVRSSILGRVHITIAPSSAPCGITAAWIMLARSVIKALLNAMLEPSEALKRLELTDDHISVAAIAEELEGYPCKQIWDQLLVFSGVGGSWLKDIKKFESECANGK